MPYSIIRLSLLAAVVMLLSTSCSREGGGPGASSAAAAGQPPQAVRALPARLADVPLEVAAIGNVEASSTVEVKARITAPVVKVHFAEGQDVREGQLLFDLDPEPFQRQVGEIEANIARDVALSRQATANIAREEAAWKNLETIAASSRKLSQEGILSKSQLDQAVANADAAKAALEAARAAVESARAAEKADRARLHETRLLLDYTKVLAPISGRAGLISAKQGNLARQHDNTLVTLLQNAPVHVAFSVPESLLQEVRKRQSAGPLAVTATTSDNRTGTGRLEFIDSAVDSSTGGIRLKATFANQDRALWPGQFVNVRILLALEPGLVVITSQAVQTGPRGKYLWVFDPANSTVSMRDVQVARNFTPSAQQGELAVVSSGLRPGENVITEGQKRLTNGSKVRLLQQQQQQK